MSYARYLASVTGALRDRVLPKVEDSEARSALEASIRALAGIGDSLDMERDAPALGGRTAARTPLDGPPENSAVRPDTATAIVAAHDRLADGNWLASPAGRDEAREMIGWERDRMAEAIGAMTAAEQPRSAMAAASGPDPLLIQPAAVEAFFREKCGAGATVTGFRQAVGGRSRQTALLTLEGDTGLPRELVIQRDHPAGISPQSVADEYPALELVADSPLRSPRPVMLERSRDYLGAPFMVVERASGTVAGPDYFDPPKDTGLALQLAEQLALLHAVDPSPVAGLLRGTLPEGDDWLSELDRLEEVFNRLAHWPSIAATAAFGWMRAHLDAIDDTRAIVHNDAAFHNILVDEGRITALLDWELVHIGHPAEDLGYCRPFIQEMGVWDAFLDAYVAAGGRRFPAAVIDYFSLRGQLYLMTLLQNGGRRMFETGATDDINLAEVGASFMPKVMLRLANIVASILEDA